MIKRPDELSADTEIERSEELGNFIKKGFKTATGIATAATGFGLSSRIAPLLNDLIPVDIAVKGINKISPKIGDFLKRGASSGLDIKEGLQFLRDKFSSSQKNAKENRSIIEQYSPELHQFLKGHIDQGRSPLEAGALAQLDPKFKPTISKMEKDHKTPFSSILEATFGSQSQAEKKYLMGSEEQTQSQNLQQKPTIKQMLTEGMSQQQPQEQQGQGQQALMDILNQIKKARGA